MSFEQDIRSLLADLVEDRVHPDTAPDVPIFPYITYQQVGGTALWFMDRAKPSHKHARMQFNVWARTRAEANQIAREIEDRLMTGSFEAAPYGGIVALYEEKLKLYGTRQDFGVWYPDP